MSLSSSAVVAFFKGSSFLAGCFSRADDPCIAMSFGVYYDQDPSSQGEPDGYFPQLVAGMKQIGVGDGQGIVENRLCFVKGDPVL